MAHGVGCLTVGGTSTVDLEEKSSRRGRKEAKCEFTGALFGS